MKGILNNIPPSLELTDLKIDLPEIQGDPEDIAIEKCKIAATIVGGVVLTEDNLILNQLLLFVNFLDYLLILINILKIIDYLHKLFRIIDCFLEIIQKKRFQC